MDVYLAFLASAGCDKDYTVGTTHTEYSGRRSVFKNRDSLYLVGVDLAH